LLVEGGETVFSEKGGGENKDALRVSFIRRGSLVFSGSQNMPKKYFIYKRQSGGLSIGRSRMILLKRVKIGRESRYLQKEGGARSSGDF